MEPIKTIWQSLPKERRNRLAVLFAALARQHQAKAQGMTEARHEPFDDLAGG